MWRDDKKGGGGKVPTGGRGLVGVPNKKISERMKPGSPGGEKNRIKTTKMEKGGYALYCK